MQFHVYCLLLSCSVVYASIYADVRPTGRRAAFVEGTEFDKISRGSLLKMLANFEETVDTRLSGRKKRPQFSAKFANNKFTRPFIYPDFKRLSHILVTMSWIQPRRVSVAFAETPGFCTQAGLTQVLYALWLNLTEISVGMAYGFAPAPLQHLGLKESSPEIFRDNNRWITSVIFLSAPFGCILCGVIMDYCGRRTAMLLCKVPLCVGWFYTGWAPSSFHVILGRVVTGIGCGMAISPPRVYIAEMTLPNMRGVLSALSAISTAVGVTLQAGLSTVMTWKILCYTNAVYTGILFITDFFLPETPFFLLTIEDCQDEVKKSLRAFRGPDYNIQEEFDELIDFKLDNKISMLTCRATAASFCNGSACKPFFIITSYIFIAQMSGVTILVLWTVDILNESMSTVNSNVGNVLMGAARFCTGLLMLFLLYRVSRTTLAVTSGLGVASVCMAIFVYLVMAKGRSIYPQIGFIIYMVLATLGYYTLPFAIMAEIFPFQIRGMMCGITLSLASLLSFGSNLYYLKILSVIGLKYIMLTFSVCSFVGILSIFRFLPETKNLTLQEIEEYYKGLRPTLVSQREVRSRQLINSSSIGSQFMKLSNRPKFRDLNLLSGR